MKKAIIFLGVIFFLFTNSYAEEIKAYTGSGSYDFSTYSNTAYGFKIEYPHNWKKFEKEELKEKTGPINAVAGFLAPEEAVVYVVVHDLMNNPVTLKEYIKIDTEDMRKFPEEVNIIEPYSETILANNLAYKIVTTGRKIQDHKMMNIVTVKNNKLYVISYLAEIDVYTKFLDSVQKMLDSFEIF